MADPAPKPSPVVANRFDRMEWAGAFGDLGTLLPFVVAYIGVLKMDPYGILLSFGIALILCGWRYRTPFPVQPMKAIGAAAATQAAQTATITQGAVLGAGLVTGVLWLLFGLTGAARLLSRLVPRHVVVGIVLGLGIGFMLQGVKMMSGGWTISAIGLIGTLLLIQNRSIPAMFLLLVFGAICGAIEHPAALELLAGSARFDPRLPRVALGRITGHDLLIGTLFLALPQLPLTLGNAVIAIREENNRLFPDRPVTENGVARSTGLMNLMSAVLGGVPMCHGAGGMAGHVAFGAATGGAPIILGSLLLVLATFFSGSVGALFTLLPTSILGVILFLTGGQLALGAGALSRHQHERFTTLAVAACCLWNVGLALLVGVGLAHAGRRARARLKAP